MAGEWLPLLMLSAFVVVATWAVFTIRRGRIEYLFLNFRRDEQSWEFWITLILFSGGALAVFYLLLS